MSRSDQEIAEINNAGTVEISDKGRIQEPVKIRVCIDNPRDNPGFPAYTFGDRWNGWIMPLFEKGTAEKVLEGIRKDNEKVCTPIKWWYDEEKDIFFYLDITTYPDDEPSEYHGELIKYKGKIIKVYPIGAGEWVWETVSAKDDEKIEKRIREIGLYAELITTMGLYRDNYGTKKLNEVIRFVKSCEPLEPDEISISVRCPECKKSFEPLTKLRRS